MIDKDQLKRSMIGLKNNPEWKMFVKHIQENIIPAHKDSSVGYACNNKTDDARRQAWIIEGLIEAIEEPDNVIDSHEDNVLVKFCNACGTMMGKMVGR